MTGRRLPRAEREAQILAVAAAMFAARGFHATNMDEVAAACGVTKPMIYSYFGSKPGLMAALVRRTGDRILAELTGVALVADPAERLREGVKRLIATLYGETEPWRVVFAAMRGEGPAVDLARGYRAALIHVGVMTMAALAPPGLAEASARRIVSPYAYALLGAAEAGVEWWLHNPGVTLAETEGTALKVLDALIELARRDLSAGRA